MKKGIIIYQSKYGATKKYVAWLQDLTGFDCIETSKARADEVAQYELVVLCGGIYASTVAGLSFLKENANWLKNKKTAVFGVGASAYAEQVISQLKAHNLTGALEEIPLFYGRGAWDEQKMKFMDRMLCKLLRKAVAKKDPATWDLSMKALMDAAGQNCDWTDKKYLLPLVEYLEC